MNKKILLLLLAFLFLSVFVLAFYLYRLNPSDDFDYSFDIENITIKKNPPSDYLEKRLTEDLQYSGYFKSINEDSMLAYSVEMTTDPENIVETVDRTFTLQSGDIFLCSELDPYITTSDGKKVKKSEVLIINAGDSVAEESALNYDDYITLINPDVVKGIPERVPLYVEGTLDKQTSEVKNRIFKFIYPACGKDF